MLDNTFAAKGVVAHAGDDGHIQQSGAMRRVYSAVSERALLHNDQWPVVLPSPHTSTPWPASISPAKTVRNCLVVMRLRSTDI